MGNNPVIFLVKTNMTTVDKFAGMQKGGRVQVRGMRGGLFVRGFVPICPFCLPTHP